MPQPLAAPSRKRSRLKPFLLVLTAFVGLSLLWVVGTRTSSSRSFPRPFSTSLLLGQVSISPLQSRYWRFEVSPTMTSARVMGSFHTIGGTGNDIEAAVAEWSECENWINGHRARLLYTSGKITNGNLDVPISQAGSYCLAFSNQMSLLSHKDISGDIALRYLLP